MTHHNFQGKFFKKFFVFFLGGGSVAGAEGRYGGMKQRKPHITHTHIHKNKESNSWLLKIDKIDRSLAQLTNEKDDQNNTIRNKQGNIKMNTKD